MKTFKLFNFNRRTAMVQADGCTAARQKIGVTPTTTPTFARFASGLCLILTMLFTLGVGQMWATGTTYYAVTTSYTVKCNTHKGTGGSDPWNSYTMTKTAYTYNGMPIYETTSIDDAWGGLGCLQFQLYDGDDWKSQVEPFCNEWTGSSTYQNKIYTGSSWVAYTYDFINLAADFTTTTWSTTDYPLTLSDGTYSITVADVTADSHKFKITKLYDTWDDAIGYSAKVSGQNLSDGPSDESSSTGNNIVFTPSHAGSVKITYNSSTGDIAILAPYQVSYAAGTGATGTVSASAVTTYGSTCTLSSSTFSKTGYTQDGWATSDGGSKVYNLGVSYTGGYEDVTLYPHWVENTYTVTYTASDGGSVTTPATSSSTVGQVTGVSIVAEASSGYHFDGWSITSGTGSFANASNASTTFYPTANATIKATFAADAEETHNVSVTYKYGSTTIRTGVTESAVGVSTARSVTAPSITGYTFSSWTLGDGLTNKSASTSANPISIVTKSTGSYTLQANYTINSYSVTFNAMSGSGSMSNESFNYNQTKALTTNAYTRAGYVFKGWATSSANATAGTVAYADGADYTMGSANVTLYAVWYKKAYFVNVPKWSSSYVKAHVYKDATSYKTWNSSDEVMTSTGTTVFGYTIYSYEFPDNFTTVKFHNNGNNETDAWTWSSTNYYYHGASTQYASVTAIRQAWKIAGSWDVKNAAWVVNDFTSYDTDEATYTVTLAASTSYSFKYVFAGTNTWYGSTGGTMSDGDTWTLDGSSDVTFTSTVAGTYTFTIDYSDVSGNSAPDCTVDFPVSYTLTYSIGSVSGTDGSISTSPSTASGSKVISGTNVTLTAPAAKSGYTWKGWYTNAAGTTGKIDDVSRTITVTMNADKTLYACYTEDSYTVTVNASSGGTVSYNGGVAGSSCSASAGVATASATISAIPNTGYAFVGWTNVDADHHITNYTATWNSTNKGWDLVVKADAATTITANFAPRFALVGAIVADGNPTGGMPGWEDAAAFAYSTGTYTISRTLTSPNTGYAFKIIDRLAESWIWRGYSSSTNNLAVDNTTTYTLTENGGNNVFFDSRGVGSYTFTVVEETIEGVVYPKVKIQDGANSHVVTWGYVSDNGQEGGTITSVVDGEATPNSIASGKYVKDGGSITVTAEANDGYRFIDFRTSSTYGGGSQLSTSNPYEVASVTADQNIYAQFAENLCTVTITANNKSAGSITVGGEAFAWDGTTNVGVYNYKSLVVTPEDGYYFSGWSLSTSPDFKVDDEGESGASTDLYGLGGTHGSTGTLTANFKELEKIYFRNLSTMDDGAWANVYVYFGVNWNGYENAVSNANAAYKVAMTQVGASDVYWAYVPRAFTSSSGTAIAFSNQSVSTSTAINTGLAATRNDYNKALQMYVPSVTWANHGAHYYNDGYWRNYPVKVATGAGYYLQTTRGTNLVEFKGQADNSDKIECTVRVDQSNTDKTFHIKSAGGIYYEPYDYEKEEYPKISSSAPTMTMKSGDTDGLTVTLTSEGIYTFIIDQSSDIMELTVGYPVSIGDYRLKHTYNDGSAKTTYSDVIKSGDAAEGQTISMYLSTAGTESLVLQKCTAIVAGVPAWDAGDDTNLSGVLTTVGTNYGVYQFDVAVSGDKVASAPTATKYTGPYYIKTDGATGGWATYKQNSMDENTLNYDTDHPEKSFNYYYCKYYNYAGTNLKCVIANDYCNALTDTLVGDAVIGIENQTTPSAASVRFSYNTYTNEIKRSYLGASVTKNFLCILGNTTASEPHIYDKNEASPSDGTAKDTIKFDDKQNWRYEIDVKADVNARAKLTATFNGQTQYFWGHAGEVGEEWDEENTEELFGGTSGIYGLTLVYDFKTNKLITAWKPTGTINSDLSLKSDIFLLREHQESPTTITFGLKDESNYASLTDVKTVYSVLRLNRWKLSNRANPTDLNTDHCNTPANINTYHPELKPGDDGYLSQHVRELYFISFPFNVKMSDIIHFGGYYNTWGIMYYDGKGRAKNGYWIDSESNWKYFTPEEFATDTLKAYEGYLIGIDLSIMAYNNTSFWTNNSSEVDIYFPSQTAVSTITQQAVNVPINQTGYLCTINRDFGGSDGDRRVKDSYWHCIGVPAYANLSHDINNGAPNTKDYEWSNKSLLYLYEWNSSTNEHTIKEASSFSFQAMYAYLVQYAGTTLSWAAAAVSPSSIAARRMKTEELRDRQFNLQLLQDEKEADHTYIRLSDDEEVTTGFEFNHDVSKMMLSGANIYTLIGKEQAAANSLPLNLEQTTIVPVGVKIATNGDYTFSISEGTQGVGVTLIDNETGSRTNLSALDYEISLEAGTYNERFMLEISPIMHTPTSVEGITGDESHVTNARKVMIDGLLYIVKNGVIYDARGAVVK